VAQDMTLEYIQAQQEKGIPYNTGILSVTTPGCVDAWFVLNERFGKMPVSELLQPTINYAREGIPTTQETADNMMIVEEGVVASDNKNFKAVYFTDGHFSRKGDIFRNPDLANTLELIGNKGRDAFYKGAIARKIETHMKERNGLMSRKDLADHQSEWVEPVSVNYRGYDVWELPPSGQGMGALQILTMLEGLDISSFGYGSTEHIYHFLEAKKLAYEDMVRYYGDPDFGDIPIESLLSEDYATQRRQQIDSDKAGTYDPGLMSSDHTVYLIAADKEGNMISFIQSNAALFGSFEVVEALRFPLQNWGAGFTLEEGHINTYAPGKRPFHTIIPAFVTREGRPFMSFGVMGGDMQTQGHVQIIMNVIDFGMNVQESGDAPRIYHRGSTNIIGHLDGVGDTFLESGFDSRVLNELMIKGHNLRMARGIFGGYQTIMLKEGVYYVPPNPARTGRQPDINLYYDENNLFTTAWQFTYFFPVGPAHQNHF